MAEKKTPPIKYTSRDFDSIKRDLVNYAKVYYPDTYKDFNHASFGSLLFDMVAYVGDMLSFYVDYQTNETFLDSAIETKNILRLAKQMGYKYPGAPASSGICAFYATIPALNGTPNEYLIPVLQRGTTLSSRGGGSFILNEDVDFSNSDSQVVVAEVDENGRPTSFAYKAYGEVISGKFETELVTIGNFEKFMRIKLPEPDVTEVISVFDSDGHEYFEVDYLSQNVVYKAVRNRASVNKESVPYVLREMIVPRRFTVEHTIDGDTFLQFGYGSQSELRNDNFPDPSAAALQVHGKPYFKDDSFDPNMLTKNDKFGVVPPEGTLTVTYRRNTLSNVNTPADSITIVNNPIVSFVQSDISGADITAIRDSIEVSNEEPIFGDVKPITPDELRTRAIDSFASQNRAVTKQDYLSIIYRMPAKFGSIKRANIIQDKNSFKRNLNLYVVSEDADGTLTDAPDALKENLKTWLNKYKMINDTVDILDGVVADIGIEFELVAALDTNSTEVLTRAINTIKDEYSKGFSFGVPFYISDIYRILNDMPEVIDVTSVKVKNKRGTDYSSTAYDVESNITRDGRFIIVPENVILQIKFPDRDIVGMVV